MSLDWVWHPLPPGHLAEVVIVIVAVQVGLALLIRRLS